VKGRSQHTGVDRVAPAREQLAVCSTTKLGTGR
jgi:hypothetical protein